MTKVRLTIEELQQLKGMGFTHMAVIARDVSVVVPGAVEAVFTRKYDALMFVEKMNGLYGPNSYEMGEI